MLYPPELRGHARHICRKNFLAETSLKGKRSVMVAVSILTHRASADMTAQAKSLHGIAPYSKNLYTCPNNDNSGHGNHTTKQYH